MKQLPRPVAPAADSSVVPANGSGGLPFPVVGMGASAGGLAALQTFFDHTPPDMGMAFVVILHLSPEHESQAAALLQRHTAMPVMQVTDVVALEPNRVYVIPPGKHLVMVDGYLNLSPPETEQELETSKEELQAINEELQTVNQELKHTIDETTAANNDLQNLFVATQIATLFLDRELRLTRYTPSAEAIFNLIPTDLGRPLSHITHRLADARLAEAAAQVLRTLVPIEQELSSTTGEWYVMHLRPYRTAEDHSTGVVLTFVDITAHKRAELALAERARLLDLSNDAIIVRNVDNRIIYWNHGATTLYGWTRDEALGQDQHALLRTEFEAPLAELIAQLHEHDRMEGEVVQVTRDGRRINAYSRWSLDRDAAGQPSAILTTYNDITDWKRAEVVRERLLAEAEQARLAAEAAVHVRDQFLSIASHELRTPLTSLLGYAHMLPQALTQGKGDPRKMAELIVRQAQRLNALIEQLLDVSRLQHGQLAIEQAPVDLGTVVEQVVHEVQATQTATTKHRVEWSRPHEPVVVMGDALRLEQVIQNLLSNAVKYSPAGGPIHVRVTTMATDAVLEVTDHGIGIPAEAQARLFDAFYRAGNAGPQFNGFGLGLHIVNAIVQQHGGRIEVDSVEGVGSTFRVMLPLQQPAR